MLYTTKILDNLKIVEIMNMNQVTIKRAPEWFCYFLANVKKMDINKNAHMTTNRTIENGRDILILTVLLHYLRRIQYLTLCGFQMGLKSFTYFYLGWLMCWPQWLLFTLWNLQPLQLYTLHHKYPYQNKDIFILIVL